MNEAEIQKRINELEFVHDQLSSELMYLDQLLRSVGFPDGLESAREVARDILDEQEVEDDLD